MDDATAQEVRSLLASSFAERLRSVGLSDREILGLAQAYVRGVGRIVAAETHVAARVAATVPEEQRAEWAAVWFAELARLSTPAFEEVHQRLLGSALVPFEPAGDAMGFAPAAVSFVDLRGSTAYMLRSTSEEIRDLVDGVFLAAHEVSRNHDVKTSKHLGDGVLLVGTDREATIAAAIELTGALERSTPLQAAAGVDYGTVTTRAGDHFGPAVNLAARLAEAAPPGGVLVGSAAVPDPPPRGTWKLGVVRGMDLPQRVLLIDRG
jgi:adenylate cyclase